MAYTMPKTRSCAQLAGQQTHAEMGTILDLSRYRATASVAGANGRLVQVGDQIFEANNLTKPIRLMGNNNGATITNPLDPALADKMARKMKARGFNFVRIHGIEAYLMMWGEMYSSPRTDVTGTRNYDPRRWEELDAFLYALKQNGMFYSFGPASKNLAINIFGRDRWDEVFNVTGTATATITAGKITNVAITTPNAVKYPDPPSVLVVDAANSNGHGAVIRSVINGAGDITGYIIDNQGDGYTASNGTANGTSTTMISHYGGTGRLKLRLRLDQTIRNHLRDVHYDFLNHVSPITGIAYKDEPALCMVECMNEAHGQLLLGAYGQAVLRPNWVNWLADRYTDIATLNTAWGSSFTGFWDPTLLVISATSSPADATKAAVARWSDSQKFIADSDAALYSWLVQEIRATGFPGMIVCRDMVSEPVISRLYTETGCNMQSVHAYPGLMDDFSAGKTYNSASSNTANAPSYYAYGTNPIYLAIACVTENVPWMFGELGFPWPGIYRGEWGLLGAGYASTHNASGITLHGQTYNAFTFGPGNRTGLKALRPHMYEHDPLTNATTWLMSKVFQAREVATLPITKTMVLNHRALNSLPNAAAMAAATLTYSFTQSGTPASYQTVMPIARQVTRWDTVNPDSTTIANTWRTDVVKTTEAQMNDHGFNVGNVGLYEASNWVFGRGNNQVWGNYEYSAPAMRYPKRVNGKPAEVFADRVAGLFGISTPKTQALVSSGKFAQGVATTVRKGNAFAANATRAETTMPGYAYNKNVDGNRFWENLLVDFIEDGTLLGVTAMDDEPIAQSSSMVVVAASNYYNTGQTHAPMEKIISSIVLNGGTGYPDVSEWAISQSPSIAAAASVIVYATAGVPTSYRIVSQTGNFTSTTLTASRVNGGAGTGLTFTYTLADAPESAEIKMGTPFGGAEEGWPILQKRFVVVFTLTGIDLSAPWVLYELDFAGKRIGELTKTITRVRNGIKIKIDSSRTRQPSVYFELAQAGV